MYTAHLSEFLFVSWPARPACVACGRNPLSWGCLTTCWLSQQHACCHFSLAGPRLPCRHHQWSPPMQVQHIFSAAQLALYCLDYRIKLGIFSDLVDIMVTEDGIKQRVEVIEKVDYLNGVAEWGDGSETHNVTEVDCHLIKVLWFHRCTSLQGLSNRTGQKNDNN